TGEDRRRLAGAADEVLADADAAEGRVDPGGAVDRGAHRDVRRTTLVADFLGHADLVDRALEDAGQAAAGPETVIPHDVGRQPVAAVVQVEYGAADRGDQRVRRRPGVHPERVQGAGIGFGVRRPSSPAVAGIVHRGT